MYLNNVLHQNHLIRLILFCPWLCLSLSGCQSVRNIYSNYQADSYSENIETNEFLLKSNQDIVGTIASIQTQGKDTLPDIARHFGLGYNDITIANTHLDPWLPKPNNQVILPLRFILPDAKREGIVLNLASMRLFQFPGQLPKRVITYPIGIGRSGWSTPTGLTKIIAKKENPVWRVPASIRKEHAIKGDPLPRIVPSGPENPLGEYAMRLGFPSYLIHGTNKPYGVGMQISHGCVRLYPEDISVLFQHTSTGTPVRIVDQPYLLGWSNEMLFLEAHKPLQEKNNADKKILFKKLKRIAITPQTLIDWQKVEKTLIQAKGIPVPILKGSYDFTAIAKAALSLTHPQQFYKQPVVKELTPQDWSITVASYPEIDSDAAEKMAAFLNHQGPPIPTRMIEQDGLAKVIAGPFQSKKETESIIKSIKREFQLNGIAHPPQSKEEIKNIGWSLSGLF